jgi:hypothetical protein
MRFKNLIYILILILSSLQVAALSGSGTLTNPYNITSCNDFAAVNTTEHYQLQNNINCENITLTTGLINNTFRGVFNGNYFNISNINTTSTNNYLGLFKNFAGTIYNTKFYNWYYTNAGEYSGIISGNCNNGTIFNITLQNFSLSGGRHLSAVCGWFGNYPNRLVYNIYASGNLAGINEIGSIAGEVYKGSNNIFHNITFKGNITTTSTKQGGIVGYSAYTKLNISDCSHIGDAPNGIIGEQLGTIINITNVFNYGNVTYNNINYGGNTTIHHIKNAYYNLNLSAQNDGTPKTTLQFTSLNNFNFSTLTWKSGAIYPELSVFYVNTTIFYTYENITITYPTQHSIQHANINMTWSVDDPHNIIDYFDISVRNTASSTIYFYSTKNLWFQLNTTLFADSSTIWIQINATDIYGKSGSDYGSMVFEIDNTPPSISVNIPAISEGHINGVCSDLNGVSSLWVNDSAFSPYLYGNGNFTLTTQTKTGLIDLNISCTDTINNTRFYNFSMLIDNSAPVCTGLYDIYNLPKYNNTIVLNVQCSDDRLVYFSKLWCPTLNRSTEIYSNSSNVSLNLILNNIGVDFSCFAYATDNISNTTISANYYMQTAQQTKWSLASCPSDTTGSLIFILSFGIVAALIIIGLNIDAVFMTLGSIGALLLSISLAYCNALFGGLMIVISVVLLIYSFFI